jgi:hypothetical protein
MIEPQAYLAYAPNGPGLFCALFWFVQDDDVYGWFTGAKAHEHPARFFMLEDYYSKRETQCFISAADDVHGDWMRSSTRDESRIDRPVPVPNELCPELDRLQDAFVREWLFYEGGEGYPQEAPLLRKRGLPVLGVNIRASRLDKLTGEGPVWTYCTPGADVRMVAYLSRRWGLDYVLE